MKHEAVEKNIGLLAFFMVIAVSIGGLIAPVFGAIAEAHGTQSVFTVLCFVPMLALLLAAFLPSPTPAR